MDESKLRPGFPGDRSQAAAEKLRALRERADQTLDDHRRRLGEIETQLSDRVRRLAEEFDGSPSEGPSPPVTAADQQAEIDSLRRQVEEGRLKHERFVETLTAVRRQLEALQTQPCATCQHAAEQLAAAEEANRRLREQFEAAARSQQEDRARHEKFVEQLAAARQAITVLQHSAGESTTELRRELEAAGAARTAAEQKLAAAEQAANERCAAAERRAAAAEEQLAAATRDMDVLHVECDALGAQAASLQRELAEVEAAHALLKQQAAALADERGNVSEATQKLQSELTSRDAELDQAHTAIESLREQLAALTAEKERLEASLAEHQGGAAEQLAGLVEQLASAEAEGEELRRQLRASESDKLNATLAVSQAEGAVGELQRALADAETRRAEAQRQLAEAESRLADVERRLAEAEQLAAAGAEALELRRQLEQAQTAAQERSQLTGDLKRTLDEATRELEVLRTSMVPKADLEAARFEFESGLATIRSLEQAAAQLEAQVAAAQAETVQVRSSMRPASDLDALQQKFDLALSDVQKLKRENGELRAELAARPEAGDRETPELIALRLERDALSAQVAELEQAAAAAAPDVDAQQERDDLQRRFEMAVDDVRQLKQENAQLRDKLAAAAPTGAGGGLDGGAGGSDWASQRAKLMAMLAEEDDQGEVSQEREVERATVNKTIAATDRVIANKDQEIAELRAALEARGEAAAADQQQHAEALDADEAIARERKRLAELTAEWEDKLRAAELEFSLERAKLAREQAALKERMFELKSAAPASGGADGDASKPRRRWLSALGLQDDAEEEKKKKK